MLKHYHHEERQTATGVQSPQSVQLAGTVSQRGFNLIENLVALLILSVGLLGLASLQAESIRSTNDAYVRSQATQLIVSLADRMRANRDAATDGQYDRKLTSQGNSNNQNKPTSRADADISAWWSQVQDTAPGAHAEIDVNNQTAEITLRWINTRKDQTGGAKRQHVQIRTKL